MEASAAAVPSLTTEGVPKSTGEKAPTSLTLKEEFMAPRIGPGRPHTLLKWLS